MEVTSGVSEVAVYYMILIWINFQYNN